MKGFIIDSTYRIKENKAYVHLFGRLENGESFQTIFHTRPYFFIKIKDIKKAQATTKVTFETEGTDFKDFQEQPVTKIIVDIPPTVPTLRKQLEKADIQCYEADVRFVQRQFIDNNILGCINIEGQYEPGQFVTRIYNEPTITKTEITQPKITILSIDIETNINADKIFSIALAIKNYKRNETNIHNLIVSKNPVKKAEHFTTEAELLKKLTTIIHETDPDIITGWNVVDFDFRVLRDRYKVNNLPFAWGRTADTNKLRIESQFFKDSSMTITGRQVLDGIALLKNAFIKLEDYKLDTAAHVFLGKKKAIQFKRNKAQEITDMYKKDPEKLMKYNQLDAELVIEILEKKDMINLCIARSMLTGMSIDRVAASIASLDSLYLRETRKQKYVCNSSHYSEREERIKGGFVRDSTPGIYDWVIVCDFKSLYPSIIRTFNVDPLSFQKDGTIKAPNGAKFRNQEGILPMLIQRLWKQRDAAKKRKDDIASFAIKITMNCFSPDTEILTGNGIKLVKDVKIGEMTYSINPKNNRIEKHPVTKKYKYGHKGEMIRIKSTVVDYLVTPNHRFLIDFGEGYVWRNAAQLAISKKDFWLPKHTEITGKKIKSFNLENYCKKNKIYYKKRKDKLQKGPKHSSIVSSFEMMDWLEFLGWYISEGFIYVSNPKRYPGKISWRGISKKVMLNQKIEKKRKKIEDLLERMELVTSKDRNGICVNNHILAEVIEKECGKDSDSKRIPPWIYELDPSLLQNLFKSMMEGDGDSTGERYSTKSRRLAEDFLRLVHHLGLYGFIYTDTSKYKGEDYKMFRVQINRTRGIRPYLSPKRNISIEKFNGSVVCIEVKPHHTVLAGRKSKLNFCGQSFFGVLASPLCRFYSLEMGNAITHWGQSILKETAEELKKDGYDVIYGDTDSIFIDAKVTNYKDAKAVGEKLPKKINEHFRRKIKKEYKRDSFLELEFEKVYKRFIMPKIRGTEVGAKKRYAGLKTDGENETMDIVGLETVRRDWTEAAKVFQTTILKKIFDKEDPIPFIKKFVKEILAGKHDDLLIYRKAIRKDLASYIKTTPPHVKAARKLDKIESTLIQYYITENGPEPLQKHKSKINYNHYIEKQIKPIANQVLVFFNQKFEDLISGKKQSSLFDY